MKLLSRRAAVVLVISLLLVFGLFAFTVKYVKDASTWVMHPTNSHLYKNGQLLLPGKVYDRFGEVLLQTVSGNKKFHTDKTVRMALMHATGDANGNVVTGAQVAFGDLLSGWDFLNGTYRFSKRSGTSSGDLKLTLDANLSITAYKAMNGRKGTVGVYNYKTGEILCMVSLPTFDPETPPNVEKNPEKYEGVYLNRFFSATYTPGSVFKLVTSAAAIDKLKNIDKAVYHCDGKVIIGGELVTCPTAHGDVTFEKALAESCNVAFAHITVELGANTLQEYADIAGFNSSLEVNGIKTAVGKVNVTGAEGGKLAWAGIGQDNDLANPLNFMTYMGAIANGGVRTTPRIISEKGMFSSLGGNKRILSEDTAKKLGEMMRNNVKSSYGENNYAGLELCAKSGTAEVGEGKKPHSWFAGYLDREDCPLAFVVVIENGGSGSKVAAPVAAKVLQAAVKSMTKE